ncbi:MAG: Ig-like domain-containing protein [Gemmatimonadales bacterium]
MWSFHGTRRLLVPAVVVLAALVAACGGTPTTPPPPSPGGAVPASLAVQAGNGQQAEPGSAVSVSPAVIVRDAAGAPVAGVTVTFSVDSGGGTLSSTTAVTGANGVATAGTWTLGPSEGRQVISARAGSLAVLSLTATARVATVTVPGQSVSTSGGTVTLTRPGSALNGTTLTIPSGALSTSGAIGFMISSTAGIAAPAGMTPLTPGLTITGPTGPLKQPAMLRLPVATPTGKILVVAVFDPSSGSLSVLPSSTHDATSITVAIPSFEGSGLATVPAASLRVNPPFIVSYAIDPSLLVPDFDSGFRPGVDDWDFQRQGVSAFPETDKVPVIDPATPMVATSLWYFVNKKGNGGKLWQRFQEAAGVPESNRRGLRWQSVAYPAFPDLYAPTSLAAVTRNAYLGNAAALARQGFYELKAAFLVSARKPQPVFVYTPTNLVNQEEPRYGIAYRTVGDAVDLAIPDAPGESFRITLAASGWTPVTITTISGNRYTVDLVSPIQYEIFVRDDLLAPQYPLVTAGTIGNAIGWPSLTLQSTYGKLDTAAVYVISDILLTWWECAACPDHGWRTTEVTPSPTQLTPAWDVRKNSDGSWPFGSLFSRLSSPRSVGKYYQNLLENGTTSRSYGAGVYQAVRGGSIPAGSTVFAWLDWTTMTLKKLPATILPTPLAGSVGVPLPMKMQITGTVPANVIYKWDFGDNKSLVQVSNNPNTQHSYTQTGTFPVVVLMLDAVTKQPLSEARADAVISGESIQFQITGTWDPTTTPSNGSYAYTDSRGGSRGTDSGLDALFFAFNFGPPDETIGVLLGIWAPAGHVFVAGETYAKFAPGAPTAGQFQLALSQNQGDPSNSPIFTPGNAGSLRLDTVERLSDGSFLASYSFTITNGAGGTITGSGVGKWR